MRVLSRADVESLLDLDELVDCVAAGLADLSAGRASSPPRVAAEISEHDAQLLAMPAFLASGALTAKLVSLFPRNTDVPTHQAVICCFDPDTGTPVAVMDGTAVTAARTAAASALATRLLARRSARVVAVIGTGVQARAHAAAMARLPAVEAIQIAGRRPAGVGAIVDDLLAAGISTQVADVDEAVRTADIVCLTTHAEQPVVQRDWITAGTHINSVGYNTSGSGEVDPETIRDAVIVVEAREAALAPPPAGAVELRRAIELGLITPAHVRAELGEIVAGTAAGRTDDEQITVFKSVGVAVEDAAAAAMILRRARDRGVGTEVGL